MSDASLEHTRPQGRRSTPRVDAILARVEPTLPVWDLCCDGGVIGCVAMDRDPSATVVFVDKRPRILDALGALLARGPHYAGRHTIACADILDMPLPPAPVNFIVAGVGTNLICAFLQRVASRTGDRIVASTSQNPERLARLAADAGFLATAREDVTSRTGRQTIWTMQPRAGATR